MASPGAERVAPRTAPERSFDAYIADCDLSLAGVTKVVETYLAELNGEIAGMDAKMTSTLERHEADFLVSYRGHMHRVQKELGKYKRQLTEREFMMRRDKLVV